MEPTFRIFRPPQVEVGQAIDQCGALLASIKADPHIFSAPTVGSTDPLPRQHKFSYIAIGIASQLVTLYISLPPPLSLSSAASSSRSQLPGAYPKRRKAPSALPPVIFLFAFTFIRMRFVSVAASALLTAGQVAVSATVKAPLATRDTKIAPKFFIISMVCSFPGTKSSPPASCRKQEN